MQSELKLVKEFRRKRAQMQSELDEIKESLFYANKEHKDSLQKMEHKVATWSMIFQQIKMFHRQISWSRLVLVVICMKLAVWHYSYVIIWYPNRLFWDFLS